MNTSSETVQVRFSRRLRGTADLKYRKKRAATTAELVLELQHLADESDSRPVCVVADAEESIVFTGLAGHDATSLQEMVLRLWARSSASATFGAVYTGRAVAQGTPWAAPEVAGHHCGRPVMHEGLCLYCGHGVPIYTSRELPGGPRHLRAASNPTRRG